MDFSFKTGNLRLMFFGFQSCLGIKLFSKLALEFESDYRGHGGIIQINEISLSNFLQIYLKKS